MGRSGLRMTPAAVRSGLEYRQGRRSLQCPAEMGMIVADNLVKVFAGPDGGEKRAVDGLSFRVGRGKIYGLLGPNGAEKTTISRRGTRTRCVLLSTSFCASRADSYRRDR